MNADSRTWDIRDAVIVAGVIAGVVFALVELMRSDIDRHAAQTGYTALAIVLFTVFGSAGVALAHWQPRFALFGAASATLSLLAAGATVVSVWSDNSYSLFGFGFGGTSGTVGAVTILLAMTSSAACVLLATVRPGEEAGARLVRIAAVGALVLFDALVVLAILDDEHRHRPQGLAIVATVYAFGAAILLVLRLLPAREEHPRSTD